MKFSLAQQIEELHLALAWRQSSSFDRHCKLQGISEKTRAYQFSRLQAALETLLLFQAHETNIRAVIELRNRGIQR